MDAIPPLNPQHYALIGAALIAALRAADPVTATARVVHSRYHPTRLTTAPPLPRQLGLLYDPAFGRSYARVIVVGAGKAGGGMAEGLCAALPPTAPLPYGWVNVKEGFAGDVARVGNIVIHEAAHPLPDERGLEGSRQIVSLALAAGRDDLLIVLLSGGGSALLEWPVAGISLADLQATARLLMHAGADITMLNTVRKHLSQVKGGGLARLAAPASVLTLILSDVIGDRPATIASGPTAPDPSSYADALAVIDRLGVGPQLPASVRRHLEAGARGQREETAKPGNQVFANCQSTLIASNSVAALAVQHTLFAKVRAVGCAVAGDDDTSPLSLHGEAADCARELVEQIASHPDHPATLISKANFMLSSVVQGDDAAARWAAVLGGETSVTVRGKGRGGRNQELALAAAIALDERREQLGKHCITIASFATDGDDGVGGAAGAIADQHTVQRAAALGLDAADYLARNDSYTFWQQLDARRGAEQPQQHIVTGPTGTNVNDLCIIIAD